MKLEALMQSLNWQKLTVTDQCVRILRRIIWVGTIAVCPVFRIPSLSQMQLTPPAFFSFL